MIPISVPAAHVCPRCHDRFETTDYLEGTVCYDCFCEIHDTSEPDSCYWFFAIGIALILLVITVVAAWVPT